MQLTLKECPVCSGTAFVDYIKAKDYLITQETFIIQKCKDCNFIFTNPRPFDYELGKYYESVNYDSHKTKKASSLKDILYQKVRNISTGKKESYLSGITKGRKLLDIGCGAGFFINYCHLKKWEVEGVEPNLKTFPDLDSSILVHSDLTSIKRNFYDVITMWHSLEHIPQLDNTLTSIYSALKQEGKLVIAVPNIGSKDFEIYKEHWAALDVPRHLYHFTQDSMKLLLDRYNLKIVKVMPLIFDSFYVSLLSEKYKNGAMNYFKAFNNGLMSNSWAKRNNSNYSSIMYTIIKK